MSNKLLIGILVIVILAGGFFLLNNQTNQTANQQSDSQQPAANSAPQERQMEEKEMIDLTDQGFSPQSIKIKPGTRVIWTNKTNGPATVNSDNHPTHLLYPFLNLGEFDPDTSVQVVFEEPGTYTYHDHLNPSRKGTVEVE